MCSFAEARSVADRTIASLASVSFRTDPLFSVCDSYRSSLQESAKKRHGAVIEAAFRDAFRTFDGVEVFCEKHTEFGREFDAVVYVRSKKILLGFDVKRGIGHHDSGKKREMASSLPIMEDKLREMAKAYGIDATTVKYAFYHHYSQDDRGHVGSITAAEIKRMTGVNPESTITDATIYFAKLVNNLISEKERNGLV